MRKADYAALAAMIKDKRATSVENRDGCPPGSPNYEYWRGQLGALSDLAYSFANAASVDSDSFLKACGIDP